MGSLTSLTVQLGSILIAIVIHEVSHAYAAKLLGDPTADRAGRLTLNPIPHIDPIGTVVLPLILVAFGSPAFGWAKPVPINPTYFADYRKGMMITGLAGPASNILLAAAGGLVLRLGGGLLPSGLAGAVYIFGILNIFLAVFNMIPLPPLDGSRVIPYFLNDKQLRGYHQLERYGIAILFGLIFLPGYLGLPDPFSLVFHYVAGPIANVLLG